MVKCRMCGKRAHRSWVYMFWHFVSCFESLATPNDLINILWIKTWWVCNSCLPEPDHSWRDRFHDIDGHQYELSWRPPFVRRG